MDDFTLNGIEKEIIQRLDNNETVYIESAASNDVINSYSIQKFKRGWSEYEEKEITFTTTACIFPKEIKLSYYDNVDTEEFNGELFVHVW